jgi:hypothetical protein
MPLLLLLLLLLLAIAPQSTLASCEGSAASTALTA